MPIPREPHMAQCALKERGTRLSALSAASVIHARMYLGGYSRL